MPDFGIMRGFNEKLFGDKLVAGQLPTQLGLIGSENVSTLLLDAFPNAAAAYSLRKLRLLYTGNAIRVRRSSDNTEQNIGFTALGILDTTALTTFCSGTNGFVTTWYDQSGNANNATQATAANQPQIVSGGSVILVNGVPSLQFDGTNDTLISTTAVDPLFITAVNRPNTTASFKTIFGADTSDGSVAVKIGSIYFQYSTPARTPTFARSTILDAIGNIDFNATGSVAVANNVLNIMTGTRTNTTISVFINDSNQGNDTTTSALRPLGGTNSGRFNLMSGYYSQSIVDHSQGNLSEIVLYTSDESSSRTGINTNINTYYGIY
jgi:hypothetical protein